MAFQERIPYEQHFNFEDECVFVDRWSAKGEWVLVTNGGAQSKAEIWLQPVLNFMTAVCNVCGGWFPDDWFPFSEE